ncbi:hypothetical protein lbkm_0879 [Lachnospiraceae bacterium KM106-2]|nr:hypothetical protein lbkm_0879 [Lachnospiraceae bacterium KM106-2]
MMDWNQSLLDYAKTHSEAEIYGSVYQYGIGEMVSMIVPTELGNILFQEEMRNVGRYDTWKPCAMFRIRLNTSYDLAVKNQNLLKKGFDLIAREYIHLEQRDFDKKYAVRSNHPEYTKIALSDLEWVDFMVRQKNLKIRICPVEEKGLDHAIKVYYHGNLIGESPSEGREIETMIECCKLTYQALERYRIEDKEVDF